MLIKKKKGESLEGNVRTVSTPTCFLLVLSSVNGYLRKWGHWLDYAAEEDTSISGLHINDHIWTT